MAQPASCDFSTRVKVRVHSVDPAANPYVAIAGMLAAGLEGIKNKLATLKPIDRNIYVMNKPEREKEDISGLPETLAAALEELKSNEVMVDVLGKHLFEHFIFTST